jgi:DNA invertase Pin-like site-specific DNA recombinase
MIYGYARVSTIEQNLDRQLEALNKFGCEVIYSDKLTGATKERPQLVALFDVLKEGDTIVITDLTRFSRSTRDLFDLVDVIKEKKANIKSLKDTWLDLSSDNPYGEFLFTVMSAVSQLERDLTKMRQKEGIAIAKKKGIYKGRPTTFTENNPRLKHALDLYEGGGYSVKEVCNVTGISEATFYRNWKRRRENEN